jgi:hypothetical protein
VDVALRAVPVLLKPGVEPDSEARAGPEVELDPAGAAAFGWPTVLVDGR